MTILVGKTYRLYSRDICLDVALGYGHHGCANAQIGAQLHNKSPTQANHPVHQDELERGGKPAEEGGSYHLSAFD
jgi:hypothetical protein